MFSFDYVSLFLILLNVFVFILFLFLVFAIIKSYKVSAGEEAEVVKQNAFKKAQEMMDTSREKSLAVIKESTEKSQEIIRNVEFLTDDAKKMLEEEFNKLSGDQLGRIDALATDLMNEYSKVLSDEKAKGVESLRHISEVIEQEAAKDLDEFKHATEDMEKVAVAELDEFRKTLEQETVASEQLVQERVNSEYEEMKARIHAYEDEKMRQIDSDIQNILAQVAKEVFGSGVDLRTSEEMVMQALNRAKKEGMFS